MQDIYWALSKIKYGHKSRAGKSHKREGDGQHHHQFFLDNSAMKSFLAITLLSLTLNLVSGYEVSSINHVLTKEIFIL